MASWGTYIQVIIYIGLLFFMVPLRIKDPLEVQFEDYLQKFNKTYNDGEYQHRFEAFKKSLKTINFLNSNKNDSAIYGLTKYSDMLPEEFHKKHLQSNFATESENESTSVESKHQSKKHHDKRSVIPSKIDWREKKKVTRIYNQENCGACWAYSTVETIESINAIKSNQTVELSVQEIIDCAGNGNKGCEGGDICSLLTWLKDSNFVLHKKKDYTEQNCKTTGNGVGILDFICEGFVGLEKVMLRLLAANGPLAVAINAQTWQNYIGGVIEYHCDGNPTKLNHAVQIVGYDLTSDIPHYIVRNSWGEDFGDNGYLYVAIGKNICGLANQVAALTVL